MNSRRRKSVISSIESSLEKPAACRRTPPPDAGDRGDVELVVRGAKRDPASRRPTTRRLADQRRHVRPSTARRKSMIPSEYGSTAPTSPKSSGAGTRRPARRPRTPAPARGRARAASASRTGRSYTPWNTLCTSAPASTSSAASRRLRRRVRGKAAGVRHERDVERFRQPGVSSSPSSRTTSRSTSPVDDAAASTRLTSPKRELSW